MIDGNELESYLSAHGQPERVEVLVADCNAIYRGNWCGGDARAKLGHLDWGPVFGGYIAALLLASTYLAVGLCISSTTENQIVALIATVFVCGLLYLPGTAAVASLVSMETGEILFSKVVEERVEDAIAYSTYDGDKNKLYPSNNGKVTTNSRALKELRRRLGARRELRSIDELRNEAVKDVCGGIAYQVKSEIGSRMQ